MNKETYKKELIRMWDSLREDYKGEHSCDGVNCEDCPLHSHVCKMTIDVFEVYGFVEVVEKWGKAHPQKKHKISRIEYMILENEFRNMCQGIANLTHYANRLSFDTSDFAFNNSYLLSDLISYGYYEGANFDTNIKYYLDNCEVEND